MRLLKWTIIVIVIVALVAAGIYLRRDRVATSLANTTLSEYGFEVTALSVDTLTPVTIEFSRIVIASAEGARYEITDLHLQLAGGGTTIRSVTAEKISIELGDAGSEPTDLGTVVQTMLDLPAMLPGVDARISTLAVTNLPELSGIQWRSSDGSQVIQFALDDTNFTMTSAPADALRHSLTVVAIAGDSESVLAIDANVAAERDQYSIDGNAVFQTTAWIPLLQQLDLLPGELERFDARFRGDVSILLDEPALGEALIGARFDLVDAANATYRSPDGFTAEVRIESMSMLSVESAYPSGDWSLATDRASGLATAAGFESVPVTASGVNCRAGIRCEMTLAVSTEDRSIGGVDVGSLSLSAPMVIEATDATRIVVDPDATLSAAQISLDTLSVGSLELGAFSGLTAVLDEDNWQAAVDALRITVTGMNAGGAEIDSVAVDLGNVQLAPQSVAASVAVPAGATASRDGLSSVLPGLDGTIGLDGDRLEAAFALSDIYSALSGDVTLNHRLDQGAGSAAVRDFRVDFDYLGLADRVDGWDFPFDIVGGGLAANADLEWQPDGDDLATSARLDAKVDSLAGTYDDYAFVDVATPIVASLDANGDVRVEPSTLSIALIDVGLPVTEVSAGYALDATGKSVRVENLSMAALGGEITAEPFEYSAGADANSIMLYARSIQLQLMVDVAEFENIEISGSMSGPMPLTIRKDGVRIDGGKLESDGSGGVIRYGAGGDALDGVVPDSDFSLVTRALSNFEFDSLSSGVEYSESGDLNLKMRLSGINPDMDPTQPVILNLSIENNVPQTLRSLRAIRSIEDILEKRAER